MVYVTVGNHVQPFSRLLRAADELAGEEGYRLIMQTGAGNYQPVNGEGRDFLPFNEAEELIRTATAVIGHAGIGTIISARRFGTPLVVCPRRAENGEHYNNHQLEICEELKKNPRPGIAIAMDETELKDALKKLLATGRAMPDLPGTEIQKALKEFVQNV